MSKAFAVEHPIKIFLFLVFFGILCMPVCRSSEPVVGRSRVFRYLLPAVKPINLKPSARFEENAVPECSGIVMSRTQKNICWAIGDSGNGPWVYRFKADFLDGRGLVISSVLKIRIAGAGNHDWEDIAVNNKGNLYIGDMGNNFSLRSDLALLKINEPDRTASVIKEERFYFHYKEQGMRGPVKNNFDAEALFAFRNRMYFFTKRRTDSLTALYRFNQLKETRKNVPVLLGYLHVDDLVTAADCLPEENLVAVLTYRSIWLLQAARGDDFLSGRKWWLPIRAGQCEGITFLDRSRLLICNESGDIFVVNRSSFFESMGQAGR